MACDPIQSVYSTRYMVTLSVPIHTLISDLLSSLTTACRFPFLPDDYQAEPPLMAGGANRAGTVSPSRQLAREERGDLR